MKKFLIIFISAVFLAIGLFGAAKAVNQPDFTIDNVVFNRAASSGSALMPTIRVKNIGQARGSADGVTIQYLTANGENKGSLFRWFTNEERTFEPGGSVEFIHAGPGAFGVGEDGRYSIYVQASGDGNSNNNATSGTISVSSSAATSAPTPDPRGPADLVIESVTFYGRGDGADGIPSIKIKNIGLGLFDASNYSGAFVGIKYLPPGGQEPERWHSSMSLRDIKVADDSRARTGTIGPGQSVELKNFIGPGEFGVGSTEEGTYIAGINLTTSYDTIRENPDNNRETGIIPIPDIVIEDVVFPDKGKPSVTVKNISNIAQLGLGATGRASVRIKYIGSNGQEPAAWHATVDLGVRRVEPGKKIKVKFDHGPEDFGITPGGSYIADIYFSAGSDLELRLIEEKRSNNEKRGQIVILTEEAEKVGYPIKELGNCKNKQDCKVYCDQPENVKACTKYGVENGLLAEEEAKAAEEINKISETNKGPGNCTTKESCAEFCEKPANIAACLSYAEKNNWLTEDELSKARKVAQVFEKGEATPGKCSTPGACKNYCSDNSHAVECVAFGKTVGLLSAEEAAEAEKIAPLMQQGRMPGGGKTREETEAYCDKKENRTECDKFFEVAGVKKGGSEKDAENAPSIFQASGSDGPGGCKTKAECDAYCDSHPGECDEQVKQAGGEVKEVTVPCSTNEECRKFCADSTNSEACKNIVIEESPEEAEASKPEVISAEIEKLRQNILEMPTQSQECVKQAWGAEAFDRVMAGQAPETPVKAETLQSCYSAGVQQRDETEMQNKPKPEGEGDEDDINSPSSQIQGQGFSFFLASIGKVLIRWVIR